MQQEPKEILIWEQKIDKTIGDQFFVHKITPKNAKQTNKLLKSFNKSIQSAERSELVLNLDIVVYKEPKDYYKVYLRYPNKEDEYVGMMTFFGVNHEHGNGNHDHPLGEKGAKLNFSYFITDDLINSNEPFEVIIKKSGVGKAKVTIEKISVTKLQ